MTKYAFLPATFFASPAAWTGVVVNEIFYHAPDDLEDLQWIELYNDSVDAADLTGWTLDGESMFVFPTGTKVATHDYVVIALDPARFAESFGGGAIGPLRNHKHRGHEDLLTITDSLGKTSGDEQWKVIQDNFNVNEVATYFAVNMVLSHWDGFFNDYFPYHDVKNGKWEMYPWDQDKTWGYYDGLPDDQVFYNMPLTFGMAGDRPSGNRDGDGGQGLHRAWWRPGGWFSGPLLANPQFRKVFLTRTKEILEKIYTKEVYSPHMEVMARSLEEDVRLRGEATGKVSDAVTQELACNVELLKDHLVKRRQLLLDQAEIQNLDSPPPPPPAAVGR